MRKAGCLLSGIRDLSGSTRPKVPLLLVRKPMSPAMMAKLNETIKGVLIG